MIFDKMLSFFENKTVPVTASTTTTDKIVDLRLNGEDIDHNLNIYIQSVGGNPSSAVTTKIETSDNGTAWTTIATQTSVGPVLYKGPMPFGVKRFVRAGVTVGGTALTKAITVKGGIVVGDVETDSVGRLQTFPPLEDLASTGDTVTA